MTRPTALVTQLLAAALGAWFVPAAFGAEERPNVVLIMTDDQGYGDLGFHGNPLIRTPNIDTMASLSARMQTFYVCPVCAPTRACLLCQSA